LPGLRFERRNPPVHVRRILFLALTLLSVCAGSAWLAGCPATGLVGIAPITAVDVPIATLLLDSNLGCGLGPNEVYKYAVVVAYQDPAEKLSFEQCPSSAFYGGVFDCYASATFGNLPPLDAGGLLNDAGTALTDGGSVEIWAWVAFYNYDTFNSLSKSKIERAATTGADKGICAIGATWTTTCVATEQDNIVAPFACPNGLQLGSMPPLADAATPDAGPRDGHASEAAADGSVEASPDAPSEAAVEGGGDAHIDAPPG